MRIGPWLREVAHRAGYSPSTLRQLMRVQQFLENQLTPEEYAGLEKRGSAPIGPLRTVMALYERQGKTQSELPKKLLQEVLEGKVSYRELRRIYSATSSEQRLSRDRSVPRNAAGHEMTELVGHLLAEHLAKLSGRGFELIRSEQAIRPSTNRLEPPFPYGLPDLLAIRKMDRHRSTVDGYEIKAIHSEFRMHNAAQLLAWASFHAMFLRHLWLVLVRSGDLDLGSKIDVVGNLRKQLNELQLDSIGLIEFMPRHRASDSRALKVVREPTSASPPHGQELLQRALRTALRPSFLARF